MREGKGAADTFFYQNVLAISGEAAVVNTRSGEALAGWLDFNMHQS